MIVTGLVSAAQHNGKKGVVKKFDEKKGRSDPPPKTPNQRVGPGALCECSDHQQKQQEQQALAEQQKQHQQHHDAEHSAAEAAAPAPAPAATGSPAAAAEAKADLGFRRYLVELTADGTMVRLKSGLLPLPRGTHTKHQHIRPILCELVSSFGVSGAVCVCVCVCVLVCLCVCASVCYNMCMIVCCVCVCCCDVCVCVVS